MVKRRQQVARPARTEPVVAEQVVPTRKVLWLPVGFAVLLACLTFTPAVRDEAALRVALFGAAAVLVMATGLLAAMATNRALRFVFTPRVQHYLQAATQVSIFAYWGWYSPAVYDALPLIVAQVCFAYAFDMLLTWYRRDEYALGFGPLPVILSINLFIWFKPDWFYLQFVMIALGFCAKEFIRWQKDGRKAHIFNPSSFPLSVFSVALIASGTTAWTSGVDIATTLFYPPHIYLFLFLVSLPGQILFGVTSMTLSAIVTTYVLGLGYFAATGTYYFIDAYIPVAVFLGMHLLFTDPSTSPRSELGRILFGVLYGVSVFVLYGLLREWGIPTFYDKLLPVPVLNLSIRAIDRLAQSRALRVFDPSHIGRRLRPQQRRLAYTAVWALVFMGMSSVEGVGDSHPGRSVPFWQQACAEDLRGACTVFRQITDGYCRDGSGWACNELGVLTVRQSSSGASAMAAMPAFAQACQRGFQVGCSNIGSIATGQPPAQGPAGPSDYPVLLQTGKGSLPALEPLQMLRLACDKGFREACEDLGLAQRPDPPVYQDGEAMPAARTAVPPQ